MRAMILAAGFGTRLKPLTDTVPKPLIPVNGKPLIHYAIALLRKHGITEIMINLHHLGEKIEAQLGDGSQLGVTLHYSYEEEILGTGGGLKQSSDFFGTDPFWVVNSDIIMEADLSQIAIQHKKTQALATMVLRAHPILKQEPARPTAFYMENTMKISETVAGTAVESHRQPFMFTGVHLMDPKLLSRLPEGFSCIFQHAYKVAIENHEAIYGYCYNGFWADLGTLEEYESTNKLLTSNTNILSYQAHRDA